LADSQPCHFRKSNTELHLKKAANHLHMLALYFTFYNFV